MAKKFKNINEDTLSQLKKIISGGKGELTQTFKIKKGFFQNIDHYDYLLKILEIFFETLKKVKEIPAANKVIRMNDNYLDMNEKQLFNCLSKKGIIIKYKLNKNNSLNDLIFDNIDYFGACIMQYSQIPDHKKTINRLSVISIFKKSWWSFGEKSTDDVTPIEMDLNNQNESSNKEEKADMGLLNDNSLKEVSYHLNEMGFEITQHGIAIAALTLASNYTAAETASFIVLSTFAFEIKEIVDDSPDIIKLMSYATSSIEIIHYLKGCTERNEMRPIQYNNDINALSNVVHVGPKQKEWLDKVLSDPNTKKRLAKFKNL